MQDNIKYVAFEAGMGGFIPREAALVCERKYGDCKDMTSVLYQMLNSIGIPAYYTWIGTRKIPYSYSEVPTPLIDNHMICSYFDGEDYIFLDATTKGIPYGIPTSFIQGKEALIGISEEEYKVVKVPVLENTECTTIDTVYAEIENNIITGIATVSYSGYSDVYLSAYINNMSETEKKEFYKNAFKKGNNKCQSTVTKINGNKDRTANLVIDYKFTLPDYIKENGDELYLNPFLKKYLTDEKINIETNKINKRNDNKEVNRNVIFFKIPEGYTVDYIPENVSYTHNKFSFDVILNYRKEKGDIEVQTYFNYNSLILDYG